MLTVLVKGARGGKCLLCKTWDFSASERNMANYVNLDRENPSIGEPCEGDPHARFGGRGGESRLYPYPSE